MNGATTVGLALREGHVREKQGNRTVHGEDSVLSSSV